MTGPIDFSALSAPIDPTALSTFAAEMRRSGWATRPMGKRQTAGAVPWIAFGALFVIVLVAATASGTMSIGPGAIMLILGFAMMAFGISLLRRPPKGFDWDTVYRLARFASGNGFNYEPTAARKPSYPGRIFVGGRHSGVDNHIWSSSGRYFDIGNYRRHTMSSTTTDAAGLTTEEVSFDECGFLAVRLDRQLPHLVLDAKANHRFALGAPPQIIFAPTLELEGDFSDHFTLSYPDGYHQDALYILTPDLMALLIDEAGDFDLEIIDDWLFVYAPTPFAANRVTYERLFRIVQTVGERAAKRSQSYRDERIGDFAANTIAEGGRRLPCCRSEWWSS